MIHKYKVVFEVDPHGRAPAAHVATDDPVACEQMLADLLGRRTRIREILHEGVPLAPKEFDAMIRTALRIQASRIACEALRIGPEEAHARFGLPA